MTAITDTIKTLTDQEAMRVLADIVDYQSRLPEPAQLRAIESGLHDAIAAEPELVDYAQPGAVSAGGLARTTLLYLSDTRPRLAPVITETIQRPHDVYRDPATFAVGALVILALQTEVKLSRNTQGHWTFTLHKKPMRDSTLGQVISKLLAAYLRGDR